MTSASAAIVIALGGATSTAWPGTRILLMSPWRALLLAGLFGALRVRIAPRVPWLPALGRGPASAFAHQREWFAAAPPWPRGAGWYVAITVLASMVWLTPHLRHPRFVPDHGDPIFSAWRLARFAHQLAHDPRHLFDGNIFYAHGATLTFSDATVLQALVAAPFILAGADPLIVSNVAFFVAFPLAALGFFYASWRITGDPRAATIGGMLGGLAAFHWEHYSHLELQYTGFMPVALVALVALLAAPTPRRGVTLGALVALQWLACMYFGLMLLTVMVPFGLMVAIAWRVRPTWRLVQALAAAAVVIAVAFAALVWPYLRSREVRGERPLAQVASFSAEAREYGHPPARLAAYQWITRERNRPERELFPGLATLGLAAIGIAPPLSAVTTALVVSGAAAFEWSLGANGLTYDDLYRWLMPFRGVRVPARFGALVGVVLALLGGVGAARLFRAAASSRLDTIAFVVIAAVVLFDLRATLTLRPYWPTAPPIYAAVTPRMVLAEFPLDRAPDYMYFSIAHGARMVGGYSGFFPDSFIRLQREVEDFPSAASLDALRRAGATHITVNCRLWGVPCPRVIRGLEATPGVSPVASGRWEGAEVRLYALQPLK